MLHLQAYYGPGVPLQPPYLYSPVMAGHVPQTYVCAPPRVFHISPTILAFFFRILTSQSCNSMGQLGATLTIKLCGKTYSLFDILLSQPLMPPYGVPYATIYSHGGVYAHPAVPFVSPCLIFSAAVSYLKSFVYWLC